MNSLKNEKIPFIQNPEIPKKEGTTRFVVISDTHCCHDSIPGGIPPGGDVMLFCGDLSINGLHEDMVNFENFLDKLYFPVKIVIAGNHDISLDKEYYKEFWKYRKHEDFLDVDKEIEELKKHCTYLKDEEITINGIRIYGSPYSVYFADWAFGINRSEIKEKWKNVPANIDIFMTHGPPYEIDELLPSFRNMLNEEMRYDVR